MALDPEGPCRQRPKDFVFGHKPVEPGQALISCQHGHLPVVKRREIGIRFDCEDGVGLRPIRGRRPPDPREVEPVAIGGREAEAPMAKFGSGHQAAMGRKGPSFRPNDVHGARSTVAGPQPPWQLNHLHIAVTAPYDHAALIKRGGGLENGRTRHS